MYVAAQDAQAQMEGRRWKIRGREVKTKSDSLIRALDRYAIVGDIMIQSDPVYAALVWGAFRGILLVAVAETRTTELLTQSLADTVTVIWFAREHALLYPSHRPLQQDDADLFLDAVADVFAESLNFVVQARLYYEKRTICGWPDLFFSCVIFCAAVLLLGISMQLTSSSLPLEIKARLLA